MTWNYFRAPCRIRAALLVVLLVLGGETSAAASPTVDEGSRAPFPGLSRSGTPSAQTTSPPAIGQASDPTDADRQTAEKMLIASGLALTLALALLLHAARRTRRMAAAPLGQARYLDLAPGLFYTLTHKPGKAYVMSFANAGVYDIYGLTAEAVMQDFSTLLALVHPDDREMRRQKLEESARDLTPFAVQYRIVHPHKGLRWLEVHSLPQRQSDGSTRWDGFVHDITERKHLEELSRKRQDEFRALAENSPDIIMRYDSQCRRIYVNPAFVRQIGKPAEALLGGTPTEYSQSAQAVLYQQALQQVLASGTEIAHEYTWVTVGGRTIVSDFRIVPERDAEGQITSVLTIGRDITERKRMEEALAARELEFHSLAENSLDVIVRYDRELRRTYMNPAWARANEIPIEEALGKRPSEIAAVISNSVQEFEDRLRRVLASGKPDEIEFGGQDRLGNIKHFAMRLVPEYGRNGEVVGLLSMANDISERKRMEDELRQREDEFRALTENLPVAVIRYDAKQRCRYLNPAAERMLRGTADELLGQAPGGPGVPATPAMIERYREEISTVMITEAAREQEFVLDALPADEQEHYEVRFVPEHDRDGKTNSVLAIWFDITERQRVEARLREALALNIGIVNAIPDLLFEVDRDGRYLNVWSQNPDFTDEHKAYLLGKKVDEVLSPDSAAIALAAIREADEQGASYGHVLAIAQDDGELRWYGHSLSKKHGRTPAEDSFIVLSHDITEHKRVEEALAKERAILETFFDALPNPAWMKNTEGRYLACNPPFEVFYGATRAEILGKTDFDFVDAELAAFFRQKDQAAATAGKPCVNEEWVTFPDGRQRMLLETVKSPVLDAAGQVIGIIGVAHDITERKQVEQYEQFRTRSLELLSSSASLTEMLEGIVQGVEQLNPEMLCSVLLLDEQGKHLLKGAAPSLPDFYNAAIDGMAIGLGVGSCGTAAFTAERVIVEDISTHPYWAKAKNLAARAGLGACWSEPVLSSSGQVLGTFAIYHRTAHAPTAADLSLIEKSAHLASIAIERKRAEEALRRSEELMRIVVDATPDWIFIKDQEHRYRMVNQGYADALHIAPADFIGKNDLDLGFPEDLVKGNPDKGIRGFWADDRQVLDSNETQIFPEDPATINGMVHTFHTIKVPLRGADGKPWGVLAFARDITERKLTEDKLRDKFVQVVMLNDRLEENARTLEEQAVELETSQEQLKETIEFTKGVIKAIPDLLFEIDQDGRYLNVWTQHHAHPAAWPEIPLGQTVHQTLSPENAATMMAGIGEAEETGLSFGKLVRIDRPEGARWFEMSISRKPGWSPSGMTFLVLSRDITERKRMEEALAVREQESRALIANSPDTIARYDRACRRLYANPAFGALVAGGVAALLGKTPSECPGGEHATLYETKIGEVFATGENTEFELKWTNADGHEVCSHIRLTPEFDAGGKLISVLCVGRDISELNEQRERIHRMAFYDALTALPNRVLFNERLQQMLKDAARHGQHAGVMLLDLDRFKMVNDTLGHSAGDILLRKAGLRLTSCLRAYDTVARLGGDEFAILLPEIRSDDDMGKIARNILDVFKEPFLLEDKEVFVSTSIGIAAFPGDSLDADELVKHADSAMYSAKRSGRNAFCFYSKDLTDSANERLVLEADLRHGFARGELELYYQPKVKLADGTLLGSEALLRWHHPARGMVGPDKFIPIAEDSGQIVEIGAWVLREACRTACDWNIPGMPPHKVAINLSPRQFQVGNLLQTVSDALSETNCRTEWIELEITESMLLDENGQVLEVLETLRAMGVTIAIDDFGTGYSSLSYLARFPIDTLKIDRSFTSRATHSEHHAELVKAMISIAHSLNQQVVAEGVETDAEVAFLREHGCHVGQGYLYSKPLPKHAFESFSLAHGWPCLTKASPAVSAAESESLSL